MDVLSILAKKRDGLELSRDEIYYFVNGCVSGQITDYQAAAFLMAGRINGFTDEETLALTMAMTTSGETLDLSDIEGLKVDKHSTGGVGDKVSLILMPVVAAAGLKVAKMSGRGLGHTGGTLDKMESIPGMRVDLSVDRFMQQVADIGIAIISQNENIDPADKIFYALRDVTATVDSIPLITASIMSKKLATGAQVLLLDVKYGNGALISDYAQCKELAQTMIEVGKGAGIKTTAAITDMNQPLGNAVGNALEVKEAIDVLSGRGPLSLRDAVLELAASIFICAGICENDQQAMSIAQQQIDSGAALDKFIAMVKEQGGDSDFSRLAQASVIEPLLAERDGFITVFDTKKIGEAAMELGAGRRKMDDVIDPAAGIILHAHIGDAVRKGDVIAELHTNKGETLDIVRDMLSIAVLIGDEHVAAPPHIYEVIS